MKFTSFCAAILATLTLNSASFGQTLFESIYGSFDQSIVVGNRESKIAIVEFSDYTCPYCSSFNKETFQILKSEFIDNNVAVFVTKSVPLEEHLHSRTAALGARCADDFGVYLEYRSLASEVAPDLSRASILMFATDEGLNTERFQSCLEEKKHQDAIDADIALSQKLGVSGIPTFVIVSRDLNTEKREVIIGAQEIEIFREKIQIVIRASE